MRVLIRFLFKTRKDLVQTRLGGAGQRICPPRYQRLQGLPELVGHLALGNRCVLYVDSVCCTARWSRPCTFPDGRLGRK